MVNKIVKCFTDDWPLLALTVFFASALVYGAVKPELNANKNRMDKQDERIHSTEKAMIKLSANQNHIIEVQSKAYEEQKEIRKDIKYIMRKVK